MPYTPQVVRRFYNIKKKLPPTLRNEVDRQVDLLCQDPEIGTQKTGDLKRVWVHKFNVFGQQYLLGYTFDEPTVTLTLLALGGHENFYRDLKRYLIPELADMRRETRKAVWNPAAETSLHGFERSTGKNPEI